MTSAGWVERSKDLQEDNDMAGEERSQKHKSKPTSEVPQFRDKQLRERLLEQRASACRGCSGSRDTVKRLIVAYEEDFPIFFLLIVSA